ncbi:MAG: hypothetical protein M1834_006161 [Cirrosporium novae-zelandiae]|nr:MAG: hypothetical protein M1834_006161 [Cirrosporium novae-zelandiae]
MRTLTPSFVHLFLLASWFFWHGNALVHPGSSSPSFSSSLSLSLDFEKSVSVCPSRTVNYITHTLPQQCLRTDWTASGGSNTTVQTTSESRASSEFISSTNEPQQGSPSHGSTSGVTTIPTELTETASSTQPVSSTFEDHSIGSQPSSAEATTSPISQELPTSTPSNPELDTDSPLDDANFLSFEEWKKQNLAKVGQSAENVGSGRGSSEPRRRPSSINNALDTLGEDGEIDFDFSGFGKPDDTETTYLSTQGQEKDVQTDNVENIDSKGLASDVRVRSKDAGKTCKERFNYASFDCAATVLKTNPESKGSSAVLVENKDHYMLNKCSAKNKFMIVELCDDILIDTLVLANFEFFSSIFRTFKVSVSDRYPVKSNKWKELGTFEARNTRQVQAFLVENPLIWARFLKIEFLTHYGNEFYCPLSLLRVHGKTMMEEFRHEGEIARGEIENEEGEESIEAGETISQEAEVVVAPLKDEGKPLLTLSPSIEPSETTPKATVGSSTTPTSPKEPEENQTQQEANSTTIKYCIVERSLLLVPTAVKTTCGLYDGESLQSINQDPAIHTYQTESVVDTTSRNSDTSSSHKNITSPVTSQVTNPHINTMSSSPSTGSTSHPQNISDSSSVVSTNGGTPSKQAENATQDSIKLSSTQPAMAAPTTQESFFKSIHKRLQLLESNSTLSLQYIEEQSRILRDAFREVEKRQLAKTSAFLENLNQTVLTELRDFRLQYDQIWQSTVIELETQREQTRQELVLFSSRLTMLADEVVFQKRMSIIQSILVLLCIGLTLFARSPNEYLELPIVQNILSRSQGSFRLRSYDIGSPPSSPDSRSRSPPWTGRKLAFFKTRRRGLLGDSQDSVPSPNIEYQPPTPTSEPADSDVDVHPSRSDSPEPASPTREVQSSPATPRGTEVIHNDPFWSDTHDDPPPSILKAAHSLGVLRAQSPLRQSEQVESQKMEGSSDEEIGTLDE